MNIIKKNLSLILTIILFNVFTIFIWQNIYNTHILGDEPHYVVFASAIADYGELEQTQAYTKGFYTLKNCFLALPQKGKNHSGHAIAGTHGLFNIHNIGLPLLITIPYKLYGVIGIKTFLIILFSTSIILLWMFLHTFNISHTNMILIIITTVFAFPFIVAANQIYPSLPSSIISLLSIIWVQYRYRIKTQYLYLIDFLILSTIAYQPLLHIKFLAPALISTLAIILISNKNKISLKKIFLYLIPITISITLLSFYNLYAFDNISGPYSEGSLQIDTTALAVFLGLHLDQFQGVFLQNPIMFIGLLFFIPFFKLNWKIATLTLILYLSYIVPNAMHPCWYGGLSYAGRFAWGSSLIWLLPTMYGLIQISKYKLHIFYVIVFISILLQLYFLSKFVFSDFSLYNNLTFYIKDINTFYSPFQHYFPSFLNNTWVYTYGTNYVYIFFFLSLLYMGQYYNANNPINFFKKIKFYLLFMLFLIISISLISSNTPPKL